jgi:hemerythrin-like domain-containing protein
MIHIGETNATIDTPVEHLVACHRRIEERLDALEKAASHLGNDRVVALEAIRKSLAFLDSSGVLHTRDEEESVFPRLRPMLTAVELRFVETLEAQHREVECAYDHLKETIAQIADAPAMSETLATAYKTQVANMATIYRLHIQSEDDILVKIARKALDSVQISAISQEMRDRRHGH